ncbi:MAG: hypothetical protein JRH13_15240, partial [Deltaproteobacteria bacterium]|nr:hypothetical protein [Deltaproteobacteria bacterium]
MNTDKKALRRQVARRIETHANELVRITRDLIRIPSVNPPGDYEEMAEKMAELYEAEGLKPVVLQAPREEVEALGLAWPRPNVVALAEGSERKPVFCLDAHMDVVAPGEESLW